MTPLPCVDPITSAIILYIMDCVSCGEGHVVMQKHCMQG